jgi:hypothetical protein
MGFDPLYDEAIIKERQPCKMAGCNKTRHTRGMCSTHYERWRMRRYAMCDIDVAAPVRDYGPVLSWKCECRVPYPGVIALFAPKERQYRDREPRDGDMVECRMCGKPIVEAA